MLQVKIFTLTCDPGHAMLDKHNAFKDCLAREQWLAIVTDRQNRHLLYFNQDFQQIYWSCPLLLYYVRSMFSPPGPVYLTLTVLVTAIYDQWEGMGDVG